MKEKGWFRRHIGAPSDAVKVAPLVLLALAGVAAAVYYVPVLTLRFMAWVWNTAVPLVWPHAPHLTPLTLLACLIALSVTLGLFWGILRGTVRAIRGW